MKAFMFWSLSLLYLIAMIASTPVLAAETSIATKIRTEKIKYFVPDYRINVLADIKDPAGIQIVRCYFRAAGEADFVFVKMSENTSRLNNLFNVRRFEAQLPAVDKEVASIEYLFLTVNGKKQIAKTQTFQIPSNPDKKPPSWQQKQDDQTVQVYTELESAQKEMAGFGDNIHIDIVESSTRFGVVTGGLYAATPASGVTAAGTATGTVTASTGVSTATIAAVSAGAVVVGGAAAAGGGGGGGGDGSPASSASAQGDCRQYDGRWAGTYSGTWCDGSPESGTWQLTCSNCNCSGSSNYGGLITGTLTDNRIRFDNFAVSDTGCGTTTASGTFSGNQVSGTFAHPLGGGGTFAGSKQ